MRLLKRGALRPGHKIVKAGPPSLHLVVACSIRIGAPLTRCMIKFHRSGAMHLVANKSRGLVNEMSALLESVFEINLVAFCNWNSVRDDNHGAFIPQTEQPGNRRPAHRPMGTKGLYARSFDSLRKLPPSSPCPSRARSHPRRLTTARISRVPFRRSAQGLNSSARRSQPRTKASRACPM